MPEKKPRGRPSKKDKIDFKQIEKLAGYGLTDAEIADFLDVNEATLNRWKSDARFLQVLKKGKLKADVEIVKSLFHRAKGYSHEDLYIAQFQGKIISKKITKHYPPDTTAALAWLNNRRKQDWRQKQTEGDGEFNDDPISFEGWNE